MELSNTPPKHARPLSPFMIGPYYKPQWTSMLSILHRITGMAMSFGTLLLTTWLVCLAAGEACYQAVSPWIFSIFGKAVLFGFTWAIFYHFCNGIRHLVWDIGKNFDIKDAKNSGYLMVAASIVLTVAVWVVALTTKVPV
jgi:succinate dehydrogenase / fumarate reductase cytochrome b subunit